MSTRDNAFGTTLLYLLAAALLLVAVLMTCELVSACLPTEEPRDPTSPMVTGEGEPSAAARP